MAERVQYVFSKITKNANKDEKENFKKILEKGFVELLGVTNPQPIKETLFMNKGSETKNPIPLYEYVWTVGITGDTEIKEGHWCDELDTNDSIIVQLIFHTHKSEFSIREISATLKQLPPFKKKKGIGEWIESISPVANVFGRGLETMGLSYGKILSTISEMKLNSASTKEFPWWIKSISVSENPAVEWHISKSYLQSVGNRFVGTLGAYFVKCESNTDDSIDNFLEMEIKVFLQKDPEGREKIFITHLEELDAPPLDKNYGLSPKLYINNIPKEKEDKRIILKISPNSN